MSKKTPQKQIKKKKPYRKIIIGIWVCFFVGIGSIALLFALASYEVLGPMPSFETLENPENKFATEIISSDGVTLGKYFAENRTPVKYTDLPQHLIKALIATEDERFYSHAGIDFKGVARAFIKMGKGGGASTITQQLAKLLFTKESGTKNKIKRALQKVKEWVIAVRLEQQYTKEEIMTMYLNKFDFLYNALGIQSASRIYFSKEPIDLKIEEAATLVAMLKNPILYNPYRKKFRERSKKRRNQVFKQLFKNEFISEKTKDSLQKLPLVVNFKPEGHRDGIATYFREYLRKFMKTWIAKNPQADGTPRNLYRDGLKIYVTIDSRMQRYAEEAVKAHISNLQSAFFKQQKENPTAPFYNLTPEEIDHLLAREIKNTDYYRALKKAGKTAEEIEKDFEQAQKIAVFSWRGTIDTIMTPLEAIKYNLHFLHSGLLSMDPLTGKIKAWVGGIDYNHFQYDHVQLGKRQLGSTFKPFVYASVIDQLGYSPCDKFPNTPYTIPKEVYGADKDWTPKNAGDKYGGELSLKQALAKSVNVITARLIHLVGPKTVANLAKRAGLTSHIPPYPSIALGTIDASLYELIDAYGMFANKGIRIKPMVVEKITDRHGTVLQEFIPESKQVMSEQSAYLMLSLLQGVTKFGSGVRLRTQYGKYPDDIATGYPYLFTNPIAGKTGTTQNHSDGWFIGIVPNLVTGVWTGAKHRSIHFEDITRGQGASMSLPTWALYMKKCYNDSILGIRDDEFEKPEGMTVRIDCPEDFINQEKNTEADSIPSPPAPQEENTDF